MTLALNMVVCTNQNIPVVVRSHAPLVNVDR